MKITYQLQAKFKFDPETPWSFIASFDDLEGARAALQKARERSEVGRHPLGGGVAVKVKHPRLTEFRLCHVETQIRRTVLGF